MGEKASCTSVCVCVKLGAREKKGGLVGGEVLLELGCDGLGRVCVGRIKLGSMV